jgi:hypothetical protein
MAATRLLVGVPLYGFDFCSAYAALLCTNKQMF